MSDTSKKAELNFDLLKLKEAGLVGPMRASAFLCFGLTPTFGDPPKSASLDSGINFQFLPNPLPVELAKQIASEYRIWLIGNALRELDLHCHLFLDAVWGVTQWSSLHGKSVASSFTIEDISQDTNAASKLKKVLEALQAIEKDAPKYLWTITRARNCITHNAGIVSKRFTNVEDKKLEVVWLGIQGRLQQGDNFTEITAEGTNFQAPDPSKESQFVIYFLERRKSFDIDTLIQFSAHELHEICFFYVWLTERVMVHVNDHFIRLGIAVPSPPTIEMKAEFEKE